MKLNYDVRKQIGEIGVDAGLCWIGDPCYILHTTPAPTAIGKSWEEFCDILHADRQYPTCKQFDYDLGHSGLGVVVSTGYGDGVYPVYVEFNDEGRVAKVSVEFISQERSVGETIATATACVSTSHTGLRHTPGPWDYDMDYIVAPDPAGLHPDIYIAEIADSDEEGRIASVAQQDANRRLIAAAPELLHALYYLLEQTVDMDRKHGVVLSEGEEDARAKSLAAIAKATTQACDWR